MVVQSHPDATRRTDFGRGNGPTLHLVSVTRLPSPAWLARLVGGPYNTYTAHTGIPTKVILRKKSLWVGSATWHKYLDTYTVD